MSESEFVIDGKPVRVGKIKSGMQRRFFKAVTQLEKNPASYGDYLDAEYELIQAATEYTQEMIDDLDTDVKYNFVTFIIECTTQDKDFQKTSMTQLDSSKKDTQI